MNAPATPVRENRENRHDRPDATTAPDPNEPSYVGPERRGAPSPRRRRLLTWYYGLKYRPFRKERHAPDGRRGVVVLQIDALAYADLRRALELGYCPTIARLMSRHDYALRRWFCGLPSATPYCQAGIFHGENEGVPAFRFYLKGEERVVTCNAPQGVQYIRDQLHSPGALAGGSSYVNLLDGDARTVAFTVATREQTSVYRRLGGTRMALLILLHPVRVMRMAAQAAWEWLLEEGARFRNEFARDRVTHAEGIFPFVRILSNVVVRELQTMAILLDVYLGVPVIYSTFMQHDELAHHFGPTNPHTLKDLRRTDARISEIWRMIRFAEQREYDLVILSDHGMTPSVSYRVRYGESLGRTVQSILDGDPVRVDGEPLHALASYGETSEYADIASRVVDTVAAVTPSQRSLIQRGLRRLGSWLRQHYGLREIFMPEKYRVDEQHEVVVTYSSCLALVYFANDKRHLERDDILGDDQRSHLYHSLLAHPGIGLIATLDGDTVHVEGARGRVRVANGRCRVLAGENPLTAYNTEPFALRALEHLVRQDNAGDLVLFGAYDGYTIVSFDDQVGAHGSLGGDQVWPFILTPPNVDVANTTLEDARDMYEGLMRRYMVDPTPAAGEAGADTAGAPPRAPNVAAG